MLLRPARVGQRSLDHAIQAGSDGADMLDRSKDRSRPSIEDTSLSMDIRFSMYDSIHLVRRTEWEIVSNEAAVYLSYDHLSALEDIMMGSMVFRYAVFHDAQYRPVGIACFQVLDLEDNGSAYGESVRGLGAVIGSRIIKELKVGSLVCGNVFHCGDHGAHFAQGIGRDEQLRVLEMAMDQLRADKRLEPKVTVMLFKDLWPEPPDGARVLRDHGYHPLAMDVTMVMDLDPKWKNLADYQEALTSKARTRLKSILGRSAAVGIKNMTAAEIRHSGPALQRLFDDVLQRSPFIFGRLKVGVYALWKAVLGDRLMFHGFYLHGDLIGFSSAFVQCGTLDAHFVGVDYALNERYGTYQRMLVDLLEFALRKGLRQINFGRTAEQAKSTIGARPVGMLFHVKHRNRVANRIIGSFIHTVGPDEFERRSPFKKQVTVGTGPGR